MNLVLPLKITSKVSTTRTQHTKPTGERSTFHAKVTLHTPPEAMLRKIKCPGRTVNAEVSQLLV